ncbi:MAG: AAA family ATPase [Chloroflexi bacterium]|nr:AAA family ATPase [Chloroflexota bacterium]
MPIQSFNIVNAKIVNRASCDSVPKLMVIAGRNGVGKSTLLYELRHISGDRVKGTGKILYAPPHRTWRRRIIRSMWLWSQEKEYSSILTQDSIPGFEGIGIPDQNRRPDSTDETPGFIKYILAQIETRRQNAIVSEIDRNSLKYPDGYAPDVYKPLREMFAILLPHLNFLHVDQSNRDNVGCLMSVQGVKEPVDIDDLSSGEKEVIALFMPLLERQINQIIRKLQKGKEVDLDSVQDTVMILDEPDLHIHPELQKRMLTYMRKRAYEDNVQFVIATHSPVIINEAASNELFSLVPREIAGDSNQLREVISNQEKFELFKDVCGDVSILTLGRPIVFIEGKTPEEMKTGPSDQRVLELLCSEAKDFTFVPMGGKKEVGKAAILLNQIISEKLVGLPVYAIVDADVDIDVKASAGIEKWEYCTIENTLFDPISIYEVLEPYREKMGIADKEAVERELLAICRDSIRDEVNRRLRAIIPPFHVQFRGNTMEELEQERDAGVEELRKRFANREENAARIRSITKEVEEMITNKTALVKFSGKSILGKFYQKFISGKGIGMSFEVFCYSVAERIGSTGRTPESIKKTLTSIKERLNT